jgi:hypothetical protein
LSQYLLVLHDLDDSPELIDCGRELAASDPAAEFVLLVPATTLPPFEALLQPDSSPRRAARERAHRLRSGILSAGLRLIATRLGNSSALLALEDALRFADYGAVVIASPHHPILHWLHRDLACRAAARFPAARVIHAAGGSRLMRPVLTRSDAATHAGS